MPRLSNSERLIRVHQRAIAEFDRIQSALRDERKQCLEDRRFYSIPGAQWEGKLGEQFENKPRYEVNKVHLAVIRIINEYRNNRITVDFISKDGTGFSVPMNRTRPPRKPMTTRLKRPLVEASAPFGCGPATRTKKIQRMSARGSR